MARVVVMTVLAMICSQRLASAQAAEDILAGAFDAVTGVPFASTMLEVVREGEESSQSPASLDKRVSAIEAALADMLPRLQRVETRLKQVQSELVKVSNINRLRELQRIRGELAAINAELKTRPADPGRRLLLVFRARQQADSAKNSVDFDIWKWSDVSAADQSLRTRVLIYPAFELYALATTTWFATLDFASVNDPQGVLGDSRAAFAEHAGFLQARADFKDVQDEAVALPEHLRNAAFCRLEAVDTFSNNAGQCEFASVCIDTMAETRTETQRQTLTMVPATAGTLCTFNPAQAVGLKGEAELRDRYGAQLMEALARDFGRLAATGSLREPFVGKFPNFIETQIFSVPLDAPVLARAGAPIGTQPAVPECLPGLNGCNFGVKLSPQTAWTVATQEAAGLGGSDRLVTLRHNGSTLCLDVNGTAAVTGAAAILFACNGTPSQTWTKRMVTNQRYTLLAKGSSLCATVTPRASGPVVQVRRPLTLQPCDGRDLQQFSNNDSTGSIGGVK